MGEHGVPRMDEHGVPWMGEHGVPRMGEHGVPWMGEHGTLNKDEHRVLKKNENREPRFVITEYNRRERAKEKKQDGVLNLAKMEYLIWSDKPAFARASSA